MRVLPSSNDVSINMAGEQLLVHPDIDLQWNEIQQSHAFVHGQWVPDNEHCQRDDISFRGCGLRDAIKRLVLKVTKESSCE